MMQEVGQPVTVVLTASDVRQVLEMPGCIDAMEQAFRMLGAGRAKRPAVSSLRATNGGFHVKSAIVERDGSEFFVSKTNANFPSNPATKSLPTIQGTIVVHDASNGVPLAVMDSIVITAMRTAAATAVAAKYLARPDAASLAVIGCGLQGAEHVRALKVVRPIRAVTFQDIDSSAAQRLAQRVARDLGVETKVASTSRDCARDADIVVTCTPSTDFLLGPNDVKKGAFVAGVGVDAEHKRELAPDLLQSSRVVVDLLEQCAAFGDLHHAIEVGAMTSEDVHAELGTIVAHGWAGWSEGQTTVFDSTGMALQDAMAALLVVERTRELKLGSKVKFSA